MSISGIQDVKSSKFMDLSMFPQRKENIDDKFQEYFSKSSSDLSFVELHGELSRKNLYP